MISAQSCIMSNSNPYSSRIAFSAALFFMTLFFNCTKTIHDRRPTTTDTPESREYFGFVLSGRHYISEARTNNVAGTCTYEAMYDSASIFRIKSYRAISDCLSGDIEIVLDSVDIEEGQRYVLGSPGARKNYLRCVYTNDCSKAPLVLTTKDGSFGYITIKKYRPDIKVISAVFSCIVTSEQGITHQIADGYFDRHFTGL